MAAEGAQDIDQLTAAGFSDAEISAHVAEQRATLLGGGFSKAEVDAHFGIKPVNNGGMWERAKSFVGEVIDDVEETAEDVAATVGDVDLMYEGILDKLMGPKDANGERPAVADLISKGGEAGWQNSIFGLMERGELPSVNTEADAGMIESLTAQATSLGLDLPWMVGGAVLGAPAGAAIGTTVAPGPGTVFGGIAGAGGGAFGAPAAIRTAIIEEYKNGSVDNWGDFADRQIAILMATAKGVTTGAMTTTAGALAKNTVTKLGAELTTMVTMSKTLEGHIPTAKDFVEGAVLLLGLKTAVKVAGKGANQVQRQTKDMTGVLQDIYAKTGKTPSEVVKDIEVNPEIMADVIAALDPTARRIPRAYEGLIEPQSPSAQRTPAEVPAEVPQTTATQAVLARLSVGKTPTSDRNTIEKVYEHSIDKLYPLAELVKKITNGEKVDAHLDPYKGARFVPAAAAKANLFLDFEVRRFGSTEVVSRGLKQILEPVNKNLDGFRAYIASKRAGELREKGLESGIPRADAEAVVREGAAVYEPVFRELVNFQNKVAEYLRDSGVIEEATFTKMLETNKEYVPFFRLFEPDKGGGIGGSIARVFNPIKRQKGSKRVIIDPLESVIKNTYLYTQLAERNMVGVKLVELAEKRGQLGEAGLIKKVKPLVKPIKIDAKEMKAISQEILNEFGIEFTPTEISVFRAQALNPSKTQIAVYRKGKREVFEVGEDVGRAMDAMSVQSANMFVKFLAVPAKTLRAGAILNPEFFARNVIRDTVAATVFSTRGFRPFVDTVLGGMSILKKDTAFRDWMMSGGANATLVAMDRNYLQQSLAKLTRDTGLTTSVINVMKSPMELLRIGSELSENATRVGAFMRKTRGARDQKSLAEGGFESREVTLDFARMGASMQGLNSITAFMNARVQGYDRLVRGFIDNPVKATALATATITMPSIALWFANHGDPRYEELPDWQKNMFWIVLTDDTIYRIPKPHELGIIFGSVPERLLDNYAKENPEIFKDIASAFHSNTLSSVIPNAFAPMIEQVTNHSFFRDSTLIPRRLERMVPEMQFTEYTTELAKTLSRVTGSVSMAMGGHPAEAGVSPIVIENYVRQWTGGLGNYAMQAIDKSLRMAGILPDPPRPEDTLADVPFVKAFVIRHPSMSAQTIRDFYERYGQAAKVKASVRALRMAGEFDKAEDLEALDDVSMMELNGFKKVIGDQATYIRMIHAAPDMTPSEKRQHIDDTYQMIIEIAKLGNEIMADALGSTLDLPKMAEDAADDGREIRPLKLGEFRQNDDGSKSTEINITVTHPKLNGGAPTNIPSLYMENGRIVHFPDERQAIEAALATGLTFPDYPTLDDAVAAAKARSAGGGIASGPIGT